VIDARTEQPIRGVLVYVEGQPSVAETDVNGRFSVLVPRGRQTINASVIHDWTCVRIGRSNRANLRNASSSSIVRDECSRRRSR
jgi:hypothetical protein